MTIDVLSLNEFAGGHPQPLPFRVEGLLVEPSVITLCSQVTGDDATVLVGRHGPGRVVLGDVSSEFGTDEDTIVSTSGAQFDQDQDGTTVEFASGNAVWAALVAVQHNPAGSISLQWVLGDIAAVASVAKPTQEEIKAALGDNAIFVVCGMARYHRSAATVIQVMVDNSDRPLYVDEDSKVEYQPSQGTPTALASKFCCFLDIPIELISTSAVADAGLYIDGIELPNLPFGGYVKNWSYLPTKAGVGGGATNTLRLALDGTDMTGNDLTVTLALSAIGQKVTGDGSFTGNTNYFKAGDKLDVVVVSSATDFTAGQGFVHVEIWENVQ